MTKEKNTKESKSFFLTLLSGFSWKKIAAFATKKMQDFVSVVNSKNYFNFIDREKDLYKGLIFSNKKQAPAMMKALSKKYKGKMNFGFVKATDSELISKFGITKFPTIVVLTDPFGYEYKKFEEEETTMQKLENFFRPFAYSKTKPPQKSMQVVELKSKSFNQGICNGKYCLIFFSQEDA